MDENCVMDALITVGFYNGWDKHILAICDYLKKAARENQWATFPNEILSEIDVDTYPRILWSVLVVAFGNYGSSPRFGWIESVRIAECVAALEEPIKDLDLEGKDGDGDG